MGSDRVELALSPQVPNIHRVIITSSCYMVAETRKERKERKRERESSSSNRSYTHNTKQLGNLGDYQVYESCHI